MLGRGLRTHPKESPRHLSTLAKPNETLCACAAGGMNLRHPSDACLVLTEVPAALPQWDGWIADYGFCTRPFNIQQSPLLELPRASLVELLFWHQSANGVVDARWWQARAAFVGCTVNGWCDHGTGPID